MERKASKMMKELGSERMYREGEGAMKMAVASNTVRAAQKLKELKKTNRQGQAKPRHH
jgi:hypothetical protein